MSTARPSPSPSDDNGTTPLLTDQIFRNRVFVGGGSPSLRGAARFLRRASSRRMREPSMRVREAAAEQIEERQSDWAYSRPVVILDLVWNFVFVLVAMAVLVMSRFESPKMPLRLWIVGYGLQCVLHMVCVSVEYNRRQQVLSASSPENSQPERGGGGGGGGWWGRANSASSSLIDGADSGDYLPETPPTDDEDDETSSVAKHLESANTMFSFIWWIIGFYWVSAGGETLTNESPQLYWLCITFLAFDVFFVVICVAVACIIGIAVCCCLPCIIALLYAVADQEGATKEDIEQLPRFKFRKIGEFEKQNGEIQESFGGIMTECETDPPNESVLSQEDAECCICLCAYDDGSDLRELPCRHHFHTSCIDKWLYINATCPLCKFNILKNANQGGIDEV